MRAIDEIVTQRLLPRILIPSLKLHSSIYISGSPSLNLYNEHRQGRYWAAMLRYVAATSVVGPSATTFPLFSQIVLSQKALRRSKLWDENTNILPCSMNSNILFLAFSAN